MDEQFHFLIVEKSMASRIIIREQFAHLKQRVSLVPSIEAALDQLTSHAYSMMLVDSSFYHALTTIDFNSSIPMGHKVPLIAVMASNGLNLHHPQPLQNHAYFPKPFSRESTLKIIEYLKDFFNTAG
ncbi:TPA: hypothetical protein ACVO5S_001895 [Legionella pneumophila]